VKVLQGEGVTFIWLDPLVTLFYVTLVGEVARSDWSYLPCKTKSSNPRVSRWAQSDNSSCLLPRPVVRL